MHNNYMELLGQFLTSDRFVILLPQQTRGLAQCWADVRPAS